MKKSFQTEMDDTQQAVSQIVCLCTTIALHQEFGVGKTRLDRITDRIHDLEDQNTEVIMTPDANGRPSKARAEAIRESWLAGYVTSDYRIPMLRAPRGRKEQQYQIAGNKAARIAFLFHSPHFVLTLMVQNLWTTGFFHPSPLPYTSIPFFVKTLYYNMLPSAISTCKIEVALFSYPNKIFFTGGFYNVSVSLSVSALDTTA